MYLVEDNFFSKIHYNASLATFSFKRMPCGNHLTLRLSISVAHNLILYRQRNKEKEDKIGLLAYMCCLTLLSQRSSNQTKVLQS